MGAAALALAGEDQSLLGGEGAGEDKALHLRAAELADQGQLLMGLRAFRGRVHAEALCQRDDGADDRGVPGAGGCGAPDEALVDLDLVERRLAEVAEARAVGAEIVEDEADAGRLQACEGRVGGLALGLEHGLGDLELQPVRLDLRRSESGGDGGGDRRIRELERREIDRHPDMVRPARRLAAGASKHPFADRADQPGLLGDRDE